MLTKYLKLLVKQFVKKNYLDSDAFLLVIFEQVWSAAIITCTHTPTRVQQAHYDTDFRHQY